MPIGQALVATCEGSQCEETEISSVGEDYSSFVFFQLVDNGWRYDVSFRSLLCPDCSKVYMEESK